MWEYRMPLIRRATVPIPSPGSMPITSLTCGLWLTSGANCALVSTVIRAPGCAARRVRSRGVVSRMSPMALKRTTRMSGAGRKAGSTLPN